MGRGTKEGICHLCGTYTKLTYEHVPPESAFNDRTFLRANVEQILKSDSLDNIRGKQQQGGLGRHTLCHQCNSDTGAWYVPSYADMAYQSMSLLKLSDGRPTLSYLFNICPANVLKQIVCMFMSLNEFGFQQAHPDLVKFVLDRHEKYLPPKYRIYAFYTLSARIRSNGLMLMLGGSDISTILGELAFPPLGFVLTSDAYIPHPDALNITSFAKYGYNQRAAVYLKLPVLDIYTPFSGDYRPRERVQSEAARSLA